MTPAEVFITDLGRVASRRQFRYLRGLSRSDRDDVLATALLECWEKRASYDPTQSLEDWFLRALENARKRFNRKLHVSADQFNMELATPDVTSNAAEAEDTFEAVVASLGAEDQELLRQMLSGEEADGPAVKTLRRKLVRFRRHPSMVEFRFAKSAKVFESDGLRSKLSRIDRAIAKLQFAPPLGNKDCPPCWRCKWYDGFTTSRYKPVRLAADPALEALVHIIAQRKLKIAERISAGTWRLHSPV